MFRTVRLPAHESSAECRCDEAPRAGCPCHFSHTHSGATLGSWTDSGRQKGEQVVEERLRLRGAEQAEPSVGDVAASGDRRRREDQDAWACAAGGAGVGGTAGPRPRADVPSPCGASGRNGGSDSPPCPFPRSRTATAETAGMARRQRNT